MNQKKSTQLRKMAELYLNDKGTKFLTKKQYLAIEKPTVADDRLYRVYVGMVNQAKKNYNRINTAIKEKLGAEWKVRLEQEY